MILPGFQSPLQALIPNVTTTADDLGFFDLEDGRAGIANGEEELRVLVEACAAMAPIHDNNSFPWWMRRPVGQHIVALLGASSIMLSTNPLLDKGCHPGHAVGWVTAIRTLAP